MLLLLLIVCGGLASCVRAFPLHRGLGKLKAVCGNAFADLPVSPSVRAYPAVNKALERLFYDLPTATVTYSFLKNYVSRPLLEEKIQQTCSEKYSDSYGAYTVIVGPDGAGKTFVTAQTLHQKPGVQTYYVSGAETQYSLLRKILESNGEPVEQNHLLDFSILHPLLVHIAKERDDQPITIVLDVVGQEVPEHVLSMVGSAARSLALAANVIVRLSDVNDVPKFDFDPRQQFLWVDGMTSEEATAYAKTLYPAIADHDLELFFDKVRSYSGQRISIRYLFYFRFVVAPAFILIHLLCCHVCVNNRIAGGHTSSCNRTLRVSIEARQASGRLRSVDGGLGCR